MRVLQWKVCSAVLRGERVGQDHKWHITVPKTLHFDSGCLIMAVCVKFSHSAVQEKDLGSLEDSLSASV